MIHKHDNTACTNVFFLLYTTTCVYSDVHVQGVNCNNTIQLSRGGGGWSIFEINILGLIFYEINNCLKDML